MKKVLFLFKVNNVVDVVTNSSSELFVLKGETKEIVEEMIKNVFPDYLDEYDMLSHISELSIDELDNYLSYMCSPHCWPATKSQYPVPDGFTFDELYEPEKDWKTGEQAPPAWNGELQYRLRNNSGERWGGLVTEENKEEIIKKLDPKGETYFLYSLDENPNWENQEKLMMIGERYHLG
jgi:hypothetical protein